MRKLYLSDGFTGESLFPTADSWLAVIDEWPSRPDTEKITGASYIGLHFVAANALKDIKASTKKATYFISFPFRRVSLTNSNL